MKPAARCSSTWASQPALRASANRPEPAGGGAPSAAISAARPTSTLGWRRASRRRSRAASARVCDATCRARARELEQRRGARIAGRVERVAEAGRHLALVAQRRTAARTCLRAADLVGELRDLLRCRAVACGPDSVASAAAMHAYGSASVDAAMRAAKLDALSS